MALTAMDAMRFVAKFSVVKKGRRTNGHTLFVRLRIHDRWRGA
jgi:hypothetical protein